MLLPLDTEGLGGWLPVLDASIGLLSEACRVSQHLWTQALTVQILRVFTQRGQGYPEAWNV